MPGGGGSIRRTRISALAWVWQRTPSWIKSPKCGGGGSKHRRAQAAGAPRTPLWNIRSLDSPA